MNTLLIQFFQRMTAPSSLILWLLNLRKPFVRKQLIKVIFAMLIAFLSAPIMAQSPLNLQQDEGASPKQASKNETNELQSLFDKGAYQDIIALSQQNPAAENLVMASRAANTIAYFSTQDKAARKASKKAYQFALDALQKNPTLVEAHVQAAISDAIIGGRISPFRAFMKGYAKRSRRSLDRALSLNPDDPWALSTSGAWHLEVKRAGGARLYNADEGIGYAQFVKAREHLPQNISIAYEMALRVLANGKTQWREEALSALSVARDHSLITSAYEAEIQRRAEAFHQAILKGSKTELAFIKAQN